MTPVTLAVRARRELAEGALFYRGRAPSGSFRRNVRAARDRIAADPTSLPYQPGSDRVRRRRVKDFPYDLLFRVLSGGAEVLSVWHHHRDPADLPS